MADPTLMNGEIKNIDDFVRLITCHKYAIIIVELLVNGLDFRWQLTLIADPSSISHHDMCYFTVSNEVKTIVASIEANYRDVFHKSNLAIYVKND